MISRLRAVLHRLRQIRASEAVDRIDFASGLGQSAWALYGLVRAIRPETCVEIGSARGRSACFIGMGLRDNRGGRLYAIDPHKQTAWNDRDSVDTYPLLLENLQQCGVSDYVTVLRTTSDEAAKGWSRPIDLLFIDGDHTYDGCQRDWELFSPFVTRFGVVAFHDTTWEYHKDSQWYRDDMGVPAFVDYLRRQGYPAITWDRDCGVTLVQPARHGVALVPTADTGLSATGSARS